jgi:hypothetical protein
VAHGEEENREVAMGDREMEEKGISVMFEYLLRKRQKKKKKR